jgi:hypothetical protein
MTHPLGYIDSPTQRYDFLRLRVSSHLLFQHASTDSSWMTAPELETLLGPRISAAGWTGEQITNQRLKARLLGLIQ